MGEREKDRSPASAASATAAAAAGASQASPDGDTRAYIAQKRRCNDNNKKEMKKEPAIFP